MHELKAFSPIIFSVFGKQTILISLPENALSFISTTLSGSIIILFFPWIADLYAITFVPSATLNVSEFPVAVRNEGDGYVIRVSPSIV